MALFYKRILITGTFIGLLGVSMTFGSSESLINKSYQFIHRHQQLTTNTLIYNGEIYVNLTDITSISGLSSTISEGTITLSPSTSSDGEYTDSYGNLYIGALKNDLPDGFGTRYLVNGGKYEGNWVNGLYEGQGTLVLENGNIYIGSFSKGFMHGEGKMYYPNGSYYKGHYEYGIQEGFGLLYIDKDNKYEGYWSNGLRNGKGKSYIDGRYKKGLWENNLMVKTLPESAFDF